MQKVFKIYSFKNCQLLASVQIMLEREALTNDRVFTPFMKCITFTLRYKDTEIVLVIVYAIPKYTSKPSIVKITT